jgi:hypothetical protein
VKLEDKKGHDNGKYAIAERLNSVFTDFKAHRIEAHGISPSLISALRDAAAPHPGQQCISSMTPPSGEFTCRRSSGFTGSINLSA